MKLLVDNLFSFDNFNKSHRQSEARRKISDFLTNPEKNNLPDAK